jgi:hypothetical protein
VLPQSDLIAVLYQTDINLLWIASTLRESGGIRSDGEGTELMRNIYQFGEQL